MENGLKLGNSFLYLCPYCGYSEESITHFMIKTKGNIIWSKKRVKCPNCQNIMKIEIIKANLTVNELGEWLYLSFAHYTKDEYGFMSGLWREREYSKINFEALIKNLYDNGLSRTFWDGWRKAKGIDRKNRLKRYVELREKIFRITQTKLK